jgi:hypothetical protein
MTIYLYKKTHNKTGLQYLGKTKRDPFNYKGSGIVWSRHLSKHGNDVTTEILKECQTNEEVKKWGIYYSKLWNVVESKDWANLKEECGDGGDMGGPEIYRKHWLAITSPDAKAKKINSLKKAFSDPEFKEKRSKISKEIAKRPDVIKKRMEYLNSAEFKSRMSGENSPAKRPEVREKRRKYMLSSLNPSYRPEVVEKRTGKNNYLYDHTIRNFIHVDGRKETCTKQELMKKYPELKSSGMSQLVNRVKPHYKGWKLGN